MKKILIGFILGSLFFSGISYAASKDLIAKVVNYKLFVDGKDKQTKDKIVTINGSVYIRINDVAKAIGYTTMVQGNKITMTSPLSFEAASNAQQPQKPKQETAKVDFTFRNTAWGMSKSDLIKNETGTLVNSSDNQILYRDKMANFDILILYYFSNDKLYEAFVQIAKDYPDDKNTQLMPDFQTLSEAITNRYGRPFDSKVDFDKDHVLEYADNYGGAIKAGYLKLLNKWSNSDTLIDEILFTQDEKLNFGATFTSKKYKDSVNGL